MPPAARSSASVRGLRYVLVLSVFLLVVLVFYADPNSQLTVAAPTKEAPVVPTHPARQGIARTKPDWSLDCPEQLAHPFLLGGVLFNGSGVESPLRVPLTSYMIHSFSPWLEREASSRFLDPAQENHYYANSPAITWYKGDLVLVARIWLNREKYKFDKKWPVNDFTDNFLYTLKFNRQLKALTNGTILGIPVPKQWWVGDGPIEPRVFQAQGRLLLSFNVAMSYSATVNMDNTILWDYELQKPIVPVIQGGSPMVNISEEGAMPRDKHWSPLLHTEGLYFVYTIDPLRILQCQLTGFCWFVYSDIPSGNFTFEHSAVHLRGGTPFELYRWPYYISVAHSTLFKTVNNHRYYTAHIVVLCVAPYRVVFVSDDLQIHPHIFANAPIVRQQWIEDDFIFPVSLILESSDRLVVGVHVNDYSSILLRFRGIHQLMQSVIQRDRDSSPSRGPPLGALHRYIHHSQQEIKNITFYHST